MWEEKREKKGGCACTRSRRGWRGGTFEWPAAKGSLDLRERRREGRLSFARFCMLGEGGRGVRAGLWVNGLIGGPYYCEEFAGKGGMSSSSVCIVCTM